LTGVFLAVITISAVWQRDTVRFLFNPDQIQIKHADEIRGGLNPGMPNRAANRDGTFTYRALDDTILFRGALCEKRLIILEVGFNVFSIPVNNVSGALRIAPELLSPYLSKPEINALGIIIASEMVSRISSGRIQYYRPVGEHILSVYGDIETGEVQIEIRWVYYEKREG
jgi:hypothetical protein